MQRHVFHIYFRPLTSISTQKLLRVVIPQIHASNKVGSSFFTTIKRGVDIRACVECRYAVDRARNANAGKPAEPRAPGKCRQLFQHVTVVSFNTDDSVVVDRAVSVN